MLVLMLLFSHNTIVVNGVVVVVFVVSRVHERFAVYMYNVCIHGALLCCVFVAADG